MSELLIEVALRFGKIILAGLIGVVVYAVLVGLLDVPGSPLVAVQSWIVGALVILLLETSAF